jgi:hypothetical protein
MEKKFDIPGFTYFAEKNNYTGSVNNDFNYKIVNGDVLTVTVWMGKFCLAKTPEENVVAVKEFEKTPEGLEELKVWLEEQLKEKGM